jgi:HD-GYP domain-containing protein (c-di-GMP phosphodiesterase class II)
LYDQANALSIILKKEFGSPFAFYDAANGQRIVTKDGGEAPTLIAELEPEAVARFASDGQADVVMRSSGRFQITLVLFECARPALVATGEVSALTRNVGELIEEQARMKKWVQAVSDRLRQADQFLSRHRDDNHLDGQGKAAWEALLRLDHLIRRVRIHKEPVKSQKRILRAALDTLGVQTIAWVPQQAEDQVLIVGESSISAWDYRLIASRIATAPDLQSSGIYLCNQVQAGSWGARYPLLFNLLAMPVNEQGQQGWVLAVNKSVPFRRSDAALLTPLMALLDLQVRGSGRYRDLQDLLAGLAKALTAAIDAKDSYTYGHSERVARIAVVLGRELGLHDEELSDIFLAGLLHDIGKIGIRDAVLGKKDSLTADEFEHVKQHVTIGYSILQDLRPISHLLPGVRNHHERVDGTGYPDGLAGDSIPLLARILAVADAYDAMTTNRPYRQSMPLTRVEEILCAGAGAQWDQRVVDAFMACRQKIHGIRQRGVGESLRHALDDALRTHSSSLLGNLLPAPH